MHMQYVDVPRSTQLHTFDTKKRESLEPDAHEAAFNYSSNATQTNETIV